jgi:hypothetical protein
LSSGTNVQGSAEARRMVDALAGKALDPESLDKMRRLGMTERQQGLNSLWAWYRCANYAVRGMDWDGTQHTEGLDHEAIATAGFIPPGFIDAGGATLPLKFRRPSAPYRLVKVIVDRFTGLLFSERRHPKLRVDGDPDTEDYAAAMADSARLWQQMILARTYGGAMGSVAVGFQFLNGKPIIEIHDPRWTHPQFKDRATLKLYEVEKRFMYPVDKRDPLTGLFHTENYWYRRIINETSDILFKPAPVGDGEEPKWETDRSVDHNLGECPVVWIQNTPNQDGIDGDPDCLGIYDLCERIDQLLSQADASTSYNCDPTPWASTDANMPDVQMGSRSVVKMPSGSSLNLLEHNGSGPKGATDLVDKFRALALEVAQCVLEHPELANRTATEIERAFSSMLAKADVMREQYGERGVKPLMTMMTEAARKLGTGTVDAAGVIQRQVVILPPRIMKDADGNIQRFPRKLGAEGSDLGTQWPGYFEPTPTDVVQSTQAATLAKTGGLIDQEHATKFVADSFRVEDVPAMLKKIAAEKQAQQEQLEQMSMGAAGPESEMDAALKPKMPSLK